MSRIRDALARLQANKSETIGVKAVSSSSDNSLASVAPELHSIPRRTVDADYLGRPITIDNESLIAAGFLASGTEQFRLADELRLIKRPILANIREAEQRALERANLVAVSSAVAGEGKTFSCINLALSIAREKELNVLLVDADCARQHATDLFSASEEPGLLDVLRDDNLDPSSVIMPTNIDSLAVMPAGTRDEHATELLASARMKTVITEISRDPSRIVLFDTSPLLMSTEPVVMSSSMGQIILVVRAGSTSKADVISAVEKLDRTKPVNLVLNQVDFGRDSGFAGYYGHYRAEMQRSTSSE